MAAVVDFPDAFAFSLYFRCTNWKHFEVGSVAS